MSAGQLGLQAQKLLPVVGQIKNPNKGEYEGSYNEKHDFVESL